MTFDEVGAPARLSGGPSPATNIPQSKSQQSKIVHFIPKTGCKFAAAFHLIIFYHKLPHISIAYI